jgi:hypothetical protein
MLVGKDYPKIELELFGLDLVEPNAFIGDTIILIVALVFYNKIKKQQENDSLFLKNWKLFYLWFGISFFCGGLGHLLYNYTGLIGKTPSWILGMVASFFIEQAMFSIYPKVEKRKTLKQISWIKLIVFVVLEIVVLTTFDLSQAPEKGLILPTLCSTIGLLFCLGVLGVYYQKRIHSSFRFLWYSVFILIASAIPQSLKINFHQYFDRNDISHVFLIIGLILYYQTIKRSPRLD